jgi:hypothetical protein
MNLFARLLGRPASPPKNDLKFVSQSLLTFREGDFCFDVGYEHLFGRTESIQIFMDQLSIPIPSDEDAKFVLRNRFRALDRELTKRGYIVLWSFPKSNFWPWPGD